MNIGKHFKLEWSNYWQTIDDENQATCKETQHWKNVIKRNISRIQL